ncbi:MAG: hypothetical protein J6V93_00100 [Clostridia bacterium]|nr:hypothetical protein [Clostridia bacterium]
MKNTRRALLLSVVSMFLCVVMLASTTFAWFTDSVESTGNIIKTGELKIDLVYTDAKGNSYSLKNADSKIFNYQLWEPGYIQYDKFELTNKGNLHFKYQLSLMSNDTLTALANVIDVYYIEVAPASVTRDSFKAENKLGTLASILANGGLLIKGDTNSFGDAINDGTEDVIFTSYIALKMQESAGNDYQNMPLYKDVNDNTAGFSVKLEATQYTYEEDSFDKTYDEDAELPVLVSSTAELAEAIAAGETNLTLSAGTYTLPSAMNTKDEYTIVGTENTVIDLSNGTYVDNASLSITGVTIKSEYKTLGSGDYACLYADNVTYTDCTFDGGLYVGRDDTKFIGCTFNMTAADNSNGQADYVWALGNDVVFDGCIFNTDGKAVLLYAHGGNEVSKATVTNCKFNANCGATAWAISNQNCAAIEIDNFGGGVELTASGNTVDTTYFSGEWRIKSYSANVTNNKITVNGTEYTTTAIDGKTMTVVDRVATVNA